MRTTIEIDDQLLQECIRVTGLKTKSEAVEHALRTVVRLHKQEEIGRFRGKLEWPGEPGTMR